MSKLYQSIFLLVPCLVIKMDGLTLGVSIMTSLYVSELSYSDTGTTVVVVFSNGM